MGAYYIVVSRSNSTPPTEESLATRNRTLEITYLALAVVGFLLPGVPMIQESVETGNILFWTQPARTMAELYANRTSTAFAFDLFATVVTAVGFIGVGGGSGWVWGGWEVVLFVAVFWFVGELPFFFFW